MILEAASVDTFYGTSHILQEVSLSVGEGEVVALLGRNGVGKTTTLRSIMGLSPPKRGSIRLRGKEIAGIPPYEVARLGVAYVPDDLRIFPDLTAEENLEIARRLSRPRRGTGTGSGCTSCSRCFRTWAPRKGSTCRAGRRRCWGSAGR